MKPTWYAMSSGNISGPFSPSQLLAELAERRIGPNDWVRNHETDEWVQIATVEARIKDLAVIAGADEDGEVSKSNETRRAIKTIRVSGISLLVVVSICIVVGIVHSKFNGPVIERGNSSTPASPLRIAGGQPAQSTGGGYLPSSAHPYRGRSEVEWVAQLQDYDPDVRLMAYDAMGVFKRNDILSSSFKSESSPTIRREIALVWSQNDPAGCSKSVIPYLAAGFHRNTFDGIWMDENLGIILNLKENAIPLKPFIEQYKATEISDRDQMRANQSDAFVQLRQRAMDHCEDDIFNCDAILKAMSGAK